MSAVPKQTAGQLRASGRLRTWSLIITFFGDAVVPRGGRVSSETISKLMSHMGVEAGAVRTALSRLTKDGWLLREKKGRRTFYRLVESHAADVSQASDQIYASITLGDEASRWVLVTLPARNQTALSMLREDLGGLMVDERTFLIDRLSESACRKIEEHDGLMVDGDAGPLPNWIHGLVCTDDDRDEHQIIQELAHGILDSEVDSGKRFDPLDAAAMQCLLIHVWRRFILARPPLSAGLEDLRGTPRIRHLVATAYAKTAPLADQWFEKNIKGQVDLKGTRFG